MNEINVIFSSRASDLGEGQIPQHRNHGIYEDVSDKVLSLIHILDLSKLFFLCCLQQVCLSLGQLVSPPLWIAFQDYPSLDKTPEIPN